MRIRPLLLSTLFPIVVLVCVTLSCRRTEEPAVTKPAAAPVTPRLADYVGHETCAECHPDIAASHAQTGHARTFTLTKDSSIAAELCNARLSSTEPHGPYEYSCDAQGVMVAIPTRFGERAFPLDYALGSGDHAVTFFTLLQKPTGETVGLEHRLTWYRSDESFDVTPGQEGLFPSLEAEFFGRVIPPEHSQRCIDCHTTTAIFEGDQLTSLYGGVHCEECHGPGAQHVEAAQSGEPLNAIFRAQTAQDQIELCGRCHRTAKDITAERLADYPPSLVRFQPVGLKMSRCFLETDGGLRCSQCHDPHSPVTSRSLDQHVATCLECHGAASQSHCPVSPSTDCITCHMPAIELVRGISFHDHWIRVRDEDDDRQGSPESTDHATIN